jgi:hypothetical protein
MLGEQPFVVGGIVRKVGKARKRHDLETSVVVSSDPGRSARRERRTGHQDCPSGREFLHICLPFTPLCGGCSSSDTRSRSLMRHNQPYPRLNSLCRYFDLENRLFEPELGGYAVDSALPRRIKAYRN